jgi:hypothetical protein
LQSVPQYCSTVVPVGILGMWRDLMHVVEFIHSNSVLRVL